MYNIFGTIVYTYNLSTYVIEVLRHNFYSRFFISIYIITSSNFKRKLRNSHEYLEKLI